MMNEVKAEIVVMSHLSDAQMELNMGLKLSVQSHINFAKYVILHCKGDLTKDIDPDALWEKFIETPQYKG
jgi:hypothetical protein